MISALLCWTMMCCEQWDSVGRDYISVLLWVEIWDSVTKTVFYTHTHARTHTYMNCDTINLSGLTHLYIFPIQESASPYTHYCGFHLHKNSACGWNNNTFTITHSRINTLQTTYFSPLQRWGDWERENWQRIFLLTRNPRRCDPEAVRRVSSSYTHTHREG